MNIVLYGISEELAQRTAMHYGFALCRPFETGTEEENRFWLQPRLENEEELLAFIERMAQHDEQIAAVVAAPTEASTETPMGDFNAVLYATRTDKLFTLGTATGAPSTTPSATRRPNTNSRASSKRSWDASAPTKGSERILCPPRPAPRVSTRGRPSAAVKTTRRHPVRRPHRPLLPAYPDETRAGAPARSIRSHPAGFAPPPDPENRPAVPTTPLLPSPAPARPDIEEEFVIQARHRTRKHRFVLLVEEIVDHPLDREVGPSQRKGLFERNVTHEIGFHAADLRLHAVVRRGEAFAVITPLVNEPPRPVSQPSGHRSRIFGDIDQLLADRLVVPATGSPLLIEGVHEKLPSAFNCQSGAGCQSSPAFNSTP